MTKLDALEAQTKKNGLKPPIHLWNPKLSGEMDLEINSRGEWVHEGAIIQRHSLVKLFASILRREGDGNYYLVTPVEKWRIQVVDTPLQVVAAEYVANEMGKKCLCVTTNVETSYEVSDNYPLVLMQPKSGVEALPMVKLDNGLTAKLSRAVYYQLAEQAEENDGSYLIPSGGGLYPLG